MFKFYHLALIITNKTMNLHFKKFCSVHLIDDPHYGKI